MNTLQVQLGPKIFSFTNFQDWVNKARGRFASHGVRSEDVICLDAAGRILKIGADFHRARDECAFPADVYLARTLDPRAEHYANRAATNQE